MRRRFTRKLTRTQKHNPRNNLEVNIHRLLNRLDIEKDAFYSNSPMTKRIDRFKIIADALFGVLPKTDYDQSFAYIINMLLAYNSKISNVMQIGEYSNKSNLEFLPNEIKFGIQDAGLSPTRYNKSIKLVITPASYIDPANRSCGELVFGFDNILTNVDFTGIGISQILRFTPTLTTDRECHINIIFERGNAVNLIVGHTFSLLRGDVSYFKGNTIKNKYLDNEVVNYDECIRYILCKQIGDLLQAYYGKLFAKKTLDGYISTCLFTNDYVLTLRCKLLQLQVVYNVQSGKTSRLFYHYPVMNEMNNAFIELWRSNAIKHRDFVLKCIASRLEEHSYLLAHGGMIRFDSSSPITEIIQNYGNHVKSAVKRFLEIVPSTLTIEEFRKQYVLCVLPTLFIGSVLNSAATFLPLFTPQEQSLLLKGDRVLRGGDHDHTELPKYEFELEEDDYTVEREYDDSDISSVHTKHALYNILKMKHPMKQKQELIYTIEGISEVLAVYFNYICESRWDDKFIKEIVDQYDNGTFGIKFISNFLTPLSSPNIIKKVGLHLGSYMTPILVHHGGNRRYTRKRKIAK
jgi:hypothetical protein